jgi:hypothetical protein
MAEHRETVVGGDPDRDRMTVIQCKLVSGNTYEVSTRSKKYGVVVQRILILPDPASRKHPDDCGNRDPQIVADQRLALG